MWYQYIFWSNFFSDFVVILNDFYVIFYFESVFLLILYLAPDDVFFALFDNFFPQTRMLQGNWCSLYFTTTYLRHLKNWQKFEFFVICESSYHQTFAINYCSKLAQHGQNMQKVILVSTRPKYIGSKLKTRTTFLFKCIFKLNENETHADVRKL